MARSIGQKRSGNVVLRTLEQTGIRRGLFGSSRAWFYVGTGLWTLRTVRRFTGRRTEVLISEELEPGQRIIIANDLASLPGTDAAASSKTRRRRRG